MKTFLSLFLVLAGSRVFGGEAEPMQTGRFEPTWASLKQYEVPRWFRDAKFGIWAHWGPQCEPEHGDWYARLMYQYVETNSSRYSNSVYAFHLRKYGPPSQFGFKDVIHEWQAENWDPDKLMALYKRAGAEYFVALANHHDNFDNWDSKYQPWNAVNLGPKKDLIAGWAKAARAQGLRFGVSEHAAHAWMWYEPAQGSDKSGPLAGVPYDGKLTKADGKGLWWEGFDPQDLYAQNHPVSKVRDTGRLWDWPTNGDCVLPDAVYCEKFYNRTLDLINKYHPDLLYFDDTVLPLYPVSDAGLRIAAHYYNTSMKWHGGKLEAVLCGKILSPEQRQCMVWDIERGQSPGIEPFTWQTDTCIGSWHYDRGVFERHRYKTTKTVVQMLVDIVSKNGNLLLSVPVRGDGTIDADETAVVEGIARWMDVNREGIFGTHPWKIFGEGPASEGAPLKAQGFNEGKGKPLGAEDVRFTVKGNTLYAFLMGWPDTQPAVIKALATNSPHVAGGKITEVTLLGYDGGLKWTQDENGLTVTLPPAAPCEHAVALKIKGLSTNP